jgi:Tfp pilus assembly protein PilF
MVTRTQQETLGSLPIGGIAPEYACLRSMMMEPQNPTMWNAMALVYLMIGRNDDAQDAIERSLDLNSSNSWTWTIWGDLLSQLGDDLEAERAYRMALELGSTESHVLTQLVRFFFRRGNYHDTIETLQNLLPQCPDNQWLWDLYTQCMMLIHPKL